MLNSLRQDMHHNINRNKETIILFCSITLVILLGTISASCGWLKQSEKLPAPVLLCSGKMDWYGITPGISTYQEVLDRLGTPIERGVEEFSDGQRIHYYSYPVNGGIISEFVQHRIFFRPDGIVDWIEEITADVDGKFHTLQEVVDIFGDELDIVYPNNDYNPYVRYQYDIHGGPDQVLAWSECGLAVLVLWEEWENMGQNDSAKQILTVRHPDFYDFSGTIPNLTSNVMMNFIFQPTTFDGFVKHYMYKIPYGLWDDYLERATR